MLVVAGSGHGAPVTCCVSTDSIAVLDLTLLSVYLSPLLHSSAGPSAQKEESLLMKTDRTAFGYHG